MVETHEIRVGSRVAGSHGERFGVVDSVQIDETSGEPTSFVVKTGFWPLTKLKKVSIDSIRQVNNNPDTIILNVSKKAFRNTPVVKS